MKPFVKAALAAGVISATVYILLPPAINDDRYVHSTMELDIPVAPVAIEDGQPPMAENPLPPQEPDTAANQITEPPEPRATIAPDQEIEQTASVPAPTEEPQESVAEPPPPEPDDHSVAVDTQPPVPDVDEAASAESLEEPDESTASVEPTETWIDHEIRPGDSMAKIFDEFGLDPKVLAAILACDKEAKDLADLRPGQLLRVRVDAEGRLQELIHERSTVSKLRIAAVADGYEAAVLEKPVETRISSASTSIESSLFSDGQSVGLSDQVIMAVAELFNWDIDFARELRQGDHFSVIYESSYVDGEKYRDGIILAAEFVNNGKTYRAIRYSDPNGVVDYYNTDGSAKKKAFIKTPVKFTRISSRFTKSRWHPVLKRWRSHKGVDYAAPTGTPVKAAGRGTVSFVGRQQGYGKVIILQHGDRYTTVYGHLSRFAKGLKKGDSVTQGDIIGYVGQTGLATGPHLHYEFRVNGKHVDPLSHKLPTAMPLPKQYMADFKRHAAPLVEQLNLLAAPKVAEQN